MVANVIFAAKELSGPEATAAIHKDLHTVDQKKIADAPRLAMSLSYVAHKKNPVDQPLPAQKEDLARGKLMRRQILNTVGMAVAWGIIPQDKLDGLRQGRSTNGKADIAHVLANGTLLLRTYAKELAGRTLATAQFLDEAESLATRIMANAGGGSAASKAQAEQDAQTIARDRLYTQLYYQYDWMRRIGAWVWGEDRDLHVPVLGSKDRKAKAANQTAAQPAATAAAPAAPAQPAATVTKIAA
jgi:hypothetical protein